MVGCGGREKPTPTDVFVAFFLQIGIVPFHFNNDINTLKKVQKPLQKIYVNQDGGELN